MLSYKNILLLLVALLFSLDFQVQATYSESYKTLDTAEANMLIVKYKSILKDTDQRISLKKNNGIISEERLFSENTSLPQANLYFLLKSNKKIPLNLIIKNYQESNLVEWIVPDAFIYPQNIKNGGFDLAPTTVPNPTKLSKKLSPTLEPTIKAQLKKNTIAVLDSGVLPNYLDQDTLIQNNTAPIIDELGHGTYITQIIQNNMPEGYEILPLKVINKEGYGKTSDVLRTLQYLIDNEKKLNLKLINMSFASDRNVLGTDICKAYESIIKKNILFIAAAGNDNQNILPDKDYFGVAPASCKGVIAVGAIQEKEKKSPASNFGKAVYAAKDSVFTNKLPQDKALCKNNWCKLEGTSIAAALFTSQLAKQIVESPTKPIAQLLANFPKVTEPSQVSAKNKFTKPILHITQPAAQNMGGAEVITKEIDKIVTETSAQIIISSPTPRPSSPTPTATPKAQSTPTSMPKPPTIPSLIPTLTSLPPTVTPPLVPTAITIPQPTSTPIPSTGKPVCRDECIDSRDECPAGTSDVGVCPMNPRFKLCTCVK